MTLSAGLSGLLCVLALFGGSANSCETADSAVKRLGKLFEVASKQDDEDFEKGSADLQHAALDAGAAATPLLRANLSSKPRWIKPPVTPRHAPDAAGGGRG
jgi:hypothetical protein